MECIFCAIAAGEIPAKVIHSDADVVAFLDISPWQPGHTVVIPRKHGENLLTDPESFTTVAAVVPTIAQKLVDKLGAEAVNVVSNAGQIAGQSVFHTHVHIVPRYADSPGMTAIFGPASETEVADVYERLVSA